EPNVALEARVGAVIAVEPARLAGVDDEPAVALRRQAFAGRFEGRFGDHRPILPSDGRERPCVRLDPAGEVLALQPRVAFPSLDERLGELVRLEELVPPALGPGAP